MCCIIMLRTLCCMIIRISENAIVHAYCMFAFALNCCQAGFATMI